MLRPIVNLNILRVNTINIKMRAKNIVLQTLAILVLAEGLILLYNLIIK